MSCLLLLACGAGGLLACDRAVPEPVHDRPAPMLVEMRPEPLDTDVPLERAMRLRFDRYLRPASVVRQSVLVTPGFIDPESGALTGPAFFFDPVYDPYDRLVVFQLGRARWVPTTLHSVRLFAPVDEADIAGFRAFDGAPFAETVAFSFVAGDLVSKPDADNDDVLPRVRFCEHDDGSDALPAAEVVLRTSCATSGCHGASPVLGMDLSGAAAMRSTAIRVVARQTMTGPSVGGTSDLPHRFGDDMPRVDPGSAGNSYLVYKLLVNRDNHPDPGEAESDSDPWLGGISSPGPSSSLEIDRLRSWFVRGKPMPMNGHLEPNQMRSVVRWVLQGAPVTFCADGSTKANGL